MKCLIDTSYLVHAIFTGDLRVIRFLRPPIPLTALEEAAYILIRISARETGRAGFYEAKKAFERGELPLAWERIRVLNKLATALGVVQHTFDDFERAKAFMAKYGLLPNDALMAATALRLNSGLLTLDEDFGRVDELSACPAV